MTIFELKGDYEYPDIEGLIQRHNQIEREKHLMKIAQVFFDQHGENDYYSKGRICLGFEGTMCECLIRDGSFLVWYFISERGNRELIALFTSLESALDFIACNRLGIPKLPFDWPELNRQFDEQSE
jgi:hypothetical protein